MGLLAEVGGVRVGVGYDQPLLGRRSARGITGFDVEIAKLIAAELGIPPRDIQFVEASAANRDSLLQREKVDFVVATYSMDRDADKRIDFAGPYLKVRQDLLVRRGNPLDIDEPQDLAGRRVCSATESAAARTIKERYPAVAKQLVLFNTYSKCRDALASGRVAAMTSDNVILSGFEHQMPGRFELIERPFRKTAYGIAVRQSDDRVFCEWINNTLRKIYANGQWARAYDRTLGRATNRIPRPPPVGSCTIPGVE